MLRITQSILASLAYIRIISILFLELRHISLSHGRGVGERRLRFQRATSFGDISFQVAERSELFVKGEFYESGGTVAVFGDMDFGDVTFIRWNIFSSVATIGGFTVDKEYHVGVLFDGTRFAQVGKFWYGGGGFFFHARELRQGDHRDVQFAGNTLEST